MAKKPQNHCDHNLVVHANTVMPDGRNPLAMHCVKCGRHWYCESVNFASMRDAPQYISPSA